TPRLQHQLLLLQAGFPLFFRQGLIVGGIDEAGGVTDTPRTEPLNNQPVEHVLVDAGSRSDIRFHFPDRPTRDRLPVHIADHRRPVQPVLPHVVQLGQPAGAPSGMGHEIHVGSVEQGYTPNRLTHLTFLPTGRTLRSHRIHRPLVKRRLVERGHLRRRIRPPLRHPHRPTTPGRSRRQHSHTGDTRRQPSPVQACPPRIPPPRLPHPPPRP